MLAQFSLRRKKMQIRDLQRGALPPRLLSVICMCAMGPSYLVYTVQKGTGNHTVLSYITQTQVTQV